MGKSKIEFKGITELSKKLKDNANVDDVGKIVQMNTSELQGKMQRAASFKGHYEWEKGVGMVFVPPTGTTKRSITFRFKFGLLSIYGEVYPTTEYSPYLIYGTRFMAAQNFFTGPFLQQKLQFVKDMQRLVR